MVERDYILRLIKQMTEALAIVFKLERGGDPHEALRVVDQTYQQLLGLDAATISSLPPDALLALIRSSGAGYQGERAIAERLTVLANLLQAGWIERSPEVKTGDLYRITEAGRTAFKAPVPIR